MYRYADNLRLSQCHYGVNSSRHNKKLNTNYVCFSFLMLITSSNVEYKIKTLPKYNRKVIAYAVFQASFRLLNLF